MALSRNVVVVPVPVTGLGRNCAETPAGRPATDIVAGPFEPLSRVMSTGMSRVSPCKTRCTCEGAERLMSGNELSGNCNVRSSKPRDEFVAPGPVAVRTNRAMSGAALVTVRADVNPVAEMGAVTVDARVLVRRLREAGLRRRVNRA